jgi:hypothetical protein
LPKFALATCVSQTPRGTEWPELPFMTAEVRRGVVERVESPGSSLFLSSHRTVTHQIRRNGRRCDESHLRATYQNLFPRSCLKSLLERRMRLFDSNRESALRLIHIARSCDISKTAATKPHPKRPRASLASRCGSGRAVHSLPLNSTDRLGILSPHIPAARHTVARGGSSQRATTGRLDTAAPLTDRHRWACP